ncbi:MAG TPA: ester cyclase [Candidatus Dormibacteraeota bacterium]|nr:ester cyclase [Candidatus Dormibacteraeota bacterium]
MDQLERNKELLRHAWAAYDNGNEAAFRAGFTDDWKEYDSDGGLQSMEQVVGSMRRQRSAFPDTHTVIEQIVAEGDLVATRSTTTATHSGKYFDLELTNRAVQSHHMLFNRIRDGKIAETWVETRSLGFYKQLTGRDAPRGDADSMA